MKNKLIFLKTSEAILEKIWAKMAELKALNLNNDINLDKSCLVIIDMINGFVKKGALQSNRVEAIVPEIVKLSYFCEKLKIKKLAFSDNHEEKSPEFKAYPVHCLKNSEESKMIEELQTIGGYTLFEKNSTNGFLEPKFQEWLSINKDITNFIIVGCCTDICILQFALTLKTHFNRLNKESRIIVPINAVNTYDGGLHDGELMHIMALYNMMINNIELVKEIRM